MTVEPLSLGIGKKAIEVAVGKAEELLRDAKDKRRSEVERCAKFLEISSVVIQGLEQEYDEILVQTENCSDRPTDIEQLRRRICEYLHVDKLRTKLVDAIEGLSDYQRIFEEHAASLWSWPWRQADKDEAVQQFQENLQQLNGYLNQLSTSLPFRESGTGVGQEAMHDILRNIDAPSGFKTCPLNELGKKYLLERDKEGMFEHVKRIRKSIEKLQHAFA